MGHRIEPLSTIRANARRCSALSLRGLPGALSSIKLAGPRVETQHPAAHRLQTNPTDPRSVPAPPAIVNLGKCKKTPTLRSVLRRIGQPS
jgi:hypothetical protein